MKEEKPEGNPVKERKPDGKLVKGVRGLVGVVKPDKDGKPLKGGRTPVGQGAPDGKPLSWRSSRPTAADGVGGSWTEKEGLWGVKLGLVPVPLGLYDDSFDGLGWQWCEKPPDGARAAM